MSKMPVAYALPFVAKVRQRDADWNEAAQEWSRQGYRPHYCKHGVNMWVDYDCACWQCEESLTVHEEALIWAHQAWSEYQDMVQIYIGIIKVLDEHKASPDLRDTIVDAVVERMNNMWKEANA